MIKIPLGRKDLKALISDEDRDLAAISWYAHNSKSGYYAAHREGTAPRERLWLHLEVMQRMISRQLKDNEVVDHKNRDKLDNRRENLRVATRSQNEANKDLTGRGYSKYRGVSFDKNRKNKPWKATITCEGEQYFLGYYAREIDAAKAYNYEAESLFGEFAYLNDVPSDICNPIAF
jgi:hypothetical protein